jgi:hypothetical protein
VVLRSEGLVGFELSGRGSNDYRLTDNGAQVVGELRRKTKPKLPECMEQIRQYVTSGSCDRLLEEVYERYPDSAELSLFRR